MSLGYLAECADALLAAGIAALAQETTGRAPPATSYLSHGEPTPDHCGEITVHLESVGHEPPRGDSGIQQSCQLVASPTFVISLFRCVTNLNDSAANPFPSGDALDTDAASLLEDLWALLTELYDRIAAGTLVPGLGEDDCENVTVGEVAPIETEGDVAGWRIPVTLSANDLGPTGS
jgi:hypothetical protein